MSKTILSRADDFGSAKAANKAILKAVDSQYIVRNVSCMAVAPYIEEGAHFLKKYQHISVGLHIALTSEWNDIRWGPLTSEMKESVCVASDGCFYQSQMELASKKPDIGMVLRECDAQLDKLSGLGLNVEYADCHMAPELWIDGLPEALQEWTVKKGLINAEHYYERKTPSPMLNLGDSNEDLQRMENWLESLKPDLQYFYIVHPAVGCEEILHFCNKQFAAGVIRNERNREYLVVTSEKWMDWREKYDIVPIRYTEAVKEPNGRKALEELVGYCAG